METFKTILDVLCAFGVLIFMALIQSVTVFAICYIFRKPIKRWLNKPPGEYWAKLERFIIEKIEEF